MLTELCQELKNWFVFEKYSGTFTIQNGVLTPSCGLIPNQYYRIMGSRLNDGVHKYGDEHDILSDEPEFNGHVWTLAIPQAVVDLSTQIDGFKESSGGISPYSSESFGGYSYDRGTAENGAAVTWQEAFASQLNKWRKI